MSATLEQFVKSVSESGLLSADELDAIRADKRPGDAQALARELIVAGKLTKYQASAAYQGKARGLILGQYVVLDRIGAGGMGQVYKAQHRRMKRLVALKVLPMAATKNPDLVKRFLREVEAAARLTHPNIVIAHDADEANGTHFLVMEYVDGHDLNSLDKLGWPLTVAEALDYTIQAARGLAYAHAQGVVHRDIKPANLLLDKSGTIKILDMGLARFEAELGSGDGLTQSGAIMGTVDYMAPEQAEDTRKADHRSDIYSLGCTLYKLLTGAAVYGGESLMSKMLAHRDQPVPSLRMKRDDVSPELDAVFQKMVAKQPAARFATMNEALAALESCKAGVGSSIQSPPPIVPAETSLTDMFADLTQFEAARPTTTVAPGATIVTVQPLPVGGAAATRPPKLPARAGSAKSSQQLWLYLGVGGGAAGMVLVLGLVLALALGLGNKSDDKRTVAKKPEVTKPEPPKLNPKPADDPKKGEPKAISPTATNKTGPAKPDPGKTTTTPFVGQPKPPSTNESVAADGPYEYLFNGQDLAGWQRVGGGKPTWSVNGGVLTSIVGEKSGSIFTTKEYGDFVLDLEFRVQAGGNGGVFLRAPLQEDASRTGLEIQILDDTAPAYANLQPDQYCGSIYRLVAASPRASRKPGEWQNLRIICSQNRVKVRLNGALVIDADLNTLSTKIATNPGISRRTGCIGLQQYGDAVDFRNIKYRAVRPGDLQ